MCTSRGDNIHNVVSDSLFYCTSCRILCSFLGEFEIAPIFGDNACVNSLHFGALGDTRTDFWFIRDLFIIALTSVSSLFIGRSKPPDTTGGYSKLQKKSNDAWQVSKPAKTRRKSSENAALLRNIDATEASLEIENPAN